MKFEQLLEKKEAKQLQLLKKLLLVGGELELHEMAAYLRISKPSLEKYVDELFLYLAPYSDQCHLFYQGSSLVLETSPEFSLNQIEYVFYHSSIKFQVLEHVLINQEIATIPLAQKLMISESSLFRKIKELNQVLAEFGLEIWQGKLMGEEARFAIFIFSCFGT